MSAALLAGLNDPVFDSQEIFRAVLDAIAQPGKIITVGKATEAPPPLMPAAAGIALSLFDLSTPIWLSAQTDNDAVRAYLAFHTNKLIPFGFAVHHANHVFEVSSLLSTLFSSSKGFHCFLFNALTRE